MEFIGAHRGNRVGTDGLVWGVEPICAALSEHGICIAPSTYYEQIGRRPLARMLADARVIDALYTLRCAQPLMRVLGSRKTWIILRSDGIDVSRCTVERVMREMGWRGALKKKSRSNASSGRWHRTAYGWPISRIAAQGRGGCSPRS